VLSSTRVEEMSSDIRAGVDDALVQLAESRLDVAAEVHALERGVLRQDLRLPSQRRRADDAAVLQALYARRRRRDEHVARVLALQHAGEDR